MVTTDALSIDGLNAFYGDSHVLHDVSLRVGAGRVLALLGRNGAGKSTCINAIIGLVKSNVRTAMLFGERIDAVQPEAVARRGIAVVPQGRRVFATLTVLENLTVAARSGTGAGPSWGLERVFVAFPRLGERQRQLAGTLSGGEQQMLAIGRALMTNPRLLLLDEPSEGLAPQIVEDVARVIRDLRESGLAILLVEQNINLARDLADDVAILNSGRLVHSAPVESIQKDQSLLDRHLGVF